MAKKKAGKKDESGYTEKDLRAAIADMNKVLNPEPALDLDDDMEMDDLITSFKEGAEMVHPDDKLDKKTVALAEKLEITLGDGEEEKVEEKKTTKKKDTKKDKKTEKKPAAKKDTPKKDNKATAKEETKLKYKRVTAFCTVLKTTKKKTLSIEEITEKTIALCTKNGLKGSAKFESVSWVLAHYMAPLIELDVVSLNEKTNKYKIA